MLKIILNDNRFLHPFNERARDLRILNKPLWLHQRDVLDPYTTRESELMPFENLPVTQEACLVYRDNLYFDAEYIRDFLQEASRYKDVCRAAFSPDDPAFREHALPLSTSYTQQGDIYLADLWYFPRGIKEGANLDTLKVRPIVLDLQSIEAGYYHVPTYMAFEQGDLIFQVPRRSLIAIDSWVHIFITDVVFGLFTRGARFEDRLGRDPGFKLKILAKAMYEGKQVLASSQLVQIGRGCTIDPHAIIDGPTPGRNTSLSIHSAMTRAMITATRETRWSRPSQERKLNSPRPMMKYVRSTAPT